MGPLEEAKDSSQPHPESRIVMAGKKDCDLKNFRGKQVHIPKLFLLPADRIVGPCLGVPDVEYVLKQTQAEVRQKKNKIRPAINQSYLFLMPRVQWLDRYMLHIRTVPTV
jgi:hypothetical protein